MDKVLVNHQIVSMRKNVKYAKNQVHRKLFKQINEIKKKIKKFEENDNIDPKLKEKHLKELNSKLKSKQIDVAELKKMKPDAFSKQALVHQSDHFEKVLQSNKSSIADRLIARVCQNKLVQSSVNKFRTENPGCEQWLPVQIELWEQKRQNRKIDKKKRKGNREAFIKPIETNLTSVNHKNSGPNDLKPTAATRENDKPKPKSKIPVTPKTKKSNLKSYTPTFRVTPMESLSSQTENVSKTDKNSITPKLTDMNRSAVIKRIDMSSIQSTSDFILSNTVNNKDSESKNDQSNNKEKPIRSDFFLSNDGKEINSVNSQRKPVSEPKNKNFNQKPLPNKQWHKFQKPPTKRYFDPPENNRSNKHKGDEFVHPSWKAKMQAKEKMKISLNRNDNDNNKPNKHIKFD